MRRSSTPEIAVEPEARDRLRTMLAAPRFEVLPLAGVVEEVAAHVPVEATVTVTSSPKHGPESTVETVVALAERGHRVVPHLAAAHFTDEGQLAAALERLDAAGVEELFVIGGDSPEEGGNRRPRGDGPGFRDGEELLAAVARRAPQMRLGVGGYPEGHATIPEAALEEGLRRKVEHAGVVVTQMCLDAASIRGWAARLHTEGIAAEICAGVPGAVSTSRLLRVGRRIGVGDSLRFLSGQLRSGQGGGLARLVGPGTWDPGELAVSLAAPAAPSEVPLDRLHLYTFNAIAETEHWRRNLLARLEEGEAA